MACVAPAHHSVILCSPVSILFMLLVLLTEHSSLLQDAGGYLMLLLQLDDINISCVRDITYCYAFLVLVLDLRHGRREKY